MTSSGELHAFLSQKGTMADLRPLGGNWSLATGINERGQVVRNSVVSSGDTHGLL
jgi:uncharacterized membrane protein